MWFYLIYIYVCLFLRLFLQYRKIQRQRQIPNSYLDLLKKSFKKTRGRFYIVFLSPEFISGYVYDCQHCKLFKTISLNDILAHSKSCENMPRPNAFDYKYVCYMCNYRTYKTTYIRAHICSHSGEKPFKCGYCSFASGRKSCINEHRRIKHSDIQF
uniref:RE1-silencing transcription factor n=1 Tax=Cacopsylla melanoneura TaxID=428564 RepID=A0A8D9FES5_9HEMI